MSLFEQYEKASSANKPDLATNSPESEGAVKSADSNTEQSPKKRGRKPGSKTAAKPTEAPWGEPIAIHSSASGQLVQFPDGVIPGALNEVAEQFAQAYRVSTSSVAAVLYFLTSAAMGKAIRVRDHWGRSLFPNAVIGMVTSDDVRVPAMLKALALPLSNLVSKAQLIHIAKSPTFEDGEPYPMLNQLYGEAKRKSFANHLVEHSGCGSILALEGAHALRAINQESAWYRRVLEGDRVEDVAHTPCVNMLALVSPDTIRHQRFTASAAAKLLHLVDIVEDGGMARMESGFRVDDNAITGLYDHFNRCLESRVAQFKAPLDIELDEDADAARSSYIRESNIDSPDAVSITATKLAAIHHTMVDTEAEAIGTGSWETGLALAEYFHAQTHHIVEVSEEIEAISNARNLLDHAAVLGKSFAQSEVYTARKVKLKKKSDVEAAIGILVDFGWLRQQLVKQKAGRGRTPVRYEWHPNVVIEPEGAVEGKEAGNS